MTLLTGGTREAEKTGQKGKSEGKESPRRKKNGDTCPLETRRQNKREDTARISRVTVRLLLHSGVFTPNPPRVSSSACTPQRSVDGVGPSLRDTRPLPRLLAAHSRFCVHPSLRSFPVSFFSVFPPLSLSLSSLQLLSPSLFFPRRAASCLCASIFSDSAEKGERGQQEPRTRGEQRALSVGGKSSSERRRSVFLTCRKLESASRPQRRTRGETRARE